MLKMILVYIATVIAIFMLSHGLYRGDKKAIVKHGLIWTGAASAAAAALTLFVYLF